MMAVADRDVRIVDFLGPEHRRRIGSPWSGTVVSSGPP
jgi:hypothetical protein